MGNLKIITASAGSGKTYRLTGEYLKLLFKEYENFHHILAVTFTNKATGEMKSRIIEKLFLLSENKSPDYVDFLMRSTGLTEIQLRDKAGTILYHLLHNFSHFHVGTIDSFFQRVLRAFLKEIGIQTGFSLELDDQMILEYAVEELLDRLDTNNELRGWLINMASAKIEEGKSWNIKNDLLSLGNEVFKEKFKSHGEVLVSLLKDKNFLNHYRSSLAKITIAFESRLKQISREALHMMREQHMEVTDFSYGHSGAAGYFEKILNDRFDPPGARVLAAVNDPGKLITTSSDKRAVLDELIHGGLHNLLSDLVEHYQRNHVKYHTAKIILSNLYALGILSDITEEINEYTYDNNILLLSEASRLINRIIDNNDTPFIYEKVGNTFNHFMIDEFQDTSRFQWENFKPLISNSLSQGHDNLIVGDVKQSIYRWRNSNWEILARQAEEDFKYAPVVKESLLDNWRSKPGIIAFNNTLFSEAPGLLHDHYNNELNNEGKVTFPEFNINHLYTDVYQHYPKEETRDRGYVRFKFLPDPGDAEQDDPVKTELLNTLDGLVKKGYAPRDIAILVRTKKEGKDLADYILDYNQAARSEGKQVFEIISDESLFLEHSSAVNFIIAVFRHIVYPSDDLNNAFLLNEYITYIDQGARSDNDMFISIKDSADGIPYKRFPAGFKSLLDELRNVPVYEMAEKLITFFALNDLQGELPYIQAFQDVMLDYTQRSRSDIYSFLNYWEERGRISSVGLHEVKEAIRILTIHKSKGLQFDAVIVPRCSWKTEGNNASGTIIWCGTRESPFNQIPVVPVKYSSGLKNTLFRDDYFNEKLKNYVDNLNLLYVAFTRAKSVLIAFGKSDALKGEQKYSRVDEIIASVFTRDTGHPDTDLSINLNTRFDPEKTTFEYGSMARSATTYKETVTRYNWLYPSRDSIDNILFVRYGEDYFSSSGRTDHSPVNHGKVMHEIFQCIKTKDDITEAVRKVYRDGKIGHSEIEAITGKIHELISDERIAGWFSGEWQVMNERDILHPSGEVRRPDRVMIRDDKVVVVDFKFGKKIVEAHKQQLKGYMKFIQEMGHTACSGYIWYFTLNKMEKV